MPEKQIVTVNSRKFDGKIHRSWQAELKTRRDSLLVLTGKFEKEIDHPHLGVVRRGTTSEEFFWFDRWYSIFRFHEPDGTFRNFYCNLNMPPKFENSVLDFVDLDVDILVGRDLSFEILDVDEFDQHSKIYCYPDEINTKVHETVDELSTMINRQQFPFDFK